MKDVININNVSSRLIDFPYEFNSGFTYSLVEDFRMNVFF